LDTACTNKNRTKTPIQVILPNGTIITSTHTATLPFPLLPAKAIEAHIFPHLRNHALLSIGVLCDSGCTVAFEQERVQVHYKGQIVLEGARVPPGLWTIDIAAPLHANATFSAPLKATALQHIHASLFSPSTQTWIKAVINKHFTTWPTFTAKEIKTLLPKSTATAMGHLDQQRKNIHSTKSKHRPKTSKAHEDPDGIEDSNPEQAPPNNTGFASLVELTEPSHKSYSDLTGRFPLHSTQGNLYVLVLYLYDANAILIEPLRNRSDNEQLRAYEAIMQ
jgi:hypothetical protein